MFFLYICLMKRPVDTLARLIIAVIKAKVYIFVFLLIMFLGAELRQCIGWPIPFSFLKSRPLRPGFFFCLKLNKQAPQVAFSTFIRCHGRGRSPLARKRWFTIAPVNTRYKYLCEAHLRVMGRSGGELGGPADEIVCRPCACARASRAYVRETLSSSDARFGPYSPPAT